MKEDPFTFLNRIANNCIAIESENKNEIYKDVQHVDRYGRDSDCEDNYFSSNDVPERSDCEIPELI